MTQAKHTPGPWDAADHGDYSDYEGRCIVVLGDGMMVRTAIVLGDDTPETRANARLTAAAPDLLEAAQLALAFALLKWGNLDPDANEAFDRVRAAIAKAEGQS